MDVNSNIQISVRDLGCCSSQTNHWMASNRVIVIERDCSNISTSEKVKIPRLAERRANKRPLPHSHRSRAPSRAGLDSPEEEIHKRSRPSRNFASESPAGKKAGSPPRSGNPGAHQSTFHRARRLSRRVTSLHVGQTIGERDDGVEYIGTLEQGQQTPKRPAS